MENGTPFAKSYLWWFALSFIIIA